MSTDKPTGDGELSVPGDERVLRTDIQEEMKDSYLTYAMSVIISRALPDVRDGLKPSQRRILVAMNDLSLSPGGSRKKCAKIAGDTSGNYHPHGEAVIYPTLVNMAQPWSMRDTLVDGQGNFGSIDGDSPAAYRYTECRMERLAEEMLADMDKETVFNEAFCMQLAAAYGLPVAEVRLVHGKVSSLLVTRVDRVVEQTVKTVQIEDFCQALGHLPGRKYEREGGPRLEDIARLLRSVSATPAQDLRALINWVLFGFFIGFGAAHGKQVALTHGTKAPSMSPFYGIWSTHVYPQMSFRMGFRIGDEDRPDWLSIARWREFADAIGVRPAFVIAALERSALALPGLARETAEAFQRRHGFAEIVRSITALIDQRARQTLVALEADEQKR